MNQQTMGIPGFFLARFTKNYDLPTKNVENPCLHTFLCLITSYETTQMGIRQQIEDVRLLAANDRHLSALTVLMLAIAATSRRRFPKGTRSVENPAKTMGDREAFTLFLGGRMRNLMFGGYGADEASNSSFIVDFKEKKHDLAYIFYKYYRCELIHEGELPQDIEFQPPSDESKLGVSLTTGDKIVLDYGWINLLISVVELAPCNSQDFGFNKLVASDSLDEEKFQETIVAKYKTSPGRFKILREAVRFITPETINASDNAEVIQRFAELVSDGRINGSAITGLSSPLK